jgi:hypothetical protein
MCTPKFIGRMKFDPGIRTPLAVLTGKLQAPRSQVKRQPSLRLGISTQRSLMGIKLIGTREALGSVSVKK